MLLFHYYQVVNWAVVVELGLARAVAAFITTSPSMDSMVEIVMVFNSTGSGGGHVSGQEVIYIWL